MVIFDISLDKEKKLVTYSYKVIWNNETTSMESKNIILGREGHIDQVFVFGDLSNTRENADLLVDTLEKVLIRIKKSL